MKRLQKWLPGLLIFAVLLTSMLGGAAYAKYTTQLHASGSVNINANLGSITLNETPKTYMLLPGVDNSYTSSVSITGKSVIPAYVFLVVDLSTQFSANGIELDLTGNWRQLQKNTETGVAVYVYAVGSDNATAITADTEISFTYTIICSENLKANVTNSVSLSITAYMGQVKENGEEASTVYNRLLK